MPRLTLQNLPRVPAYLAEQVRYTVARRADQRRVTYSTSAPSWGTPLLTAPLSTRVPEADRPALAATLAHHLAGRFDVLGSGWVPMQHGEAAVGVLGHRYAPGPSVQVDPEGQWLHDRVPPANLAAAMAAWQGVKGPYMPLDWQRDVKSGYRWDERTWYIDVPVAHVPGADIKVPWEVGRMQHLPRLALAYGLARAGQDGFAQPATYARAFQNQVLDFIAQNPPRFGVHWRCAMEVGIRVANWVMAYDLFLAEGAVFDPVFDDHVRRSVYAHGRHIVANLEWWKDTHRNNHVLADLAGLVFAGARLASTPETDAWLRLANHLLDRETERQFNADGTNIEGSVYYHAFSAEIVAWAALVLSGVPANRQQRVATADADVLPKAAARLFPTSGAPLVHLAAAHRKRFEGMATFLNAIKRPDGTFPQVGDNDGGRFMKVAVPYRRLSVAQACARYGNLAGYRGLRPEETFWEEDLLSYTAPEGLIASVCADVGLDAAAAAIVRGRPQGRADASRSRLAPPHLGPSADTAWADARALVEAAPATHQSEWVGSRAAEGGAVTVAGSAEFGLYVWQGPGLYLAVRCGPTSAPMLGAHAHRDQLAIELWLDGQDVVRDPGTGLYSAAPQWRNRYRSAAAHHAIRPAGVEPAFHPNSFAGPDWPRAQCLYVGARGFIGRIRFPRGAFYRVVTLEKDAIRVRDVGETSPPAPLDFGQPMVPFSPGFGKWR